MAGRWSLLFDGFASKRSKILLKNENSRSKTEIMGQDFDNSKTNIERQNNLKERYLTNETESTSCSNDPVVVHKLDCQNFGLNS